MQAIKTQYFGPSNVRGARVKASAAAGSITLGWDHALNIDDNHAAAAKALATKLEWNGKWAGGTIETKGDRFMVWVLETWAESFEVLRRPTGTVYGAGQPLIVGE